MDLQTFVSSALVATLASVMLNRAIEWQKEAAAARAQLRGILLELAYAERCLKSYLERKPSLVSDPGYRVATQFLASSISTLAASGALRGAEAERLHQLYIDAEAVNRSLDSVAVPPSAPTSKLGLLAAATFIKATRLPHDTFEQLGRDLPAARAAAEAALARLAWFEQQD